MVKRVLERRRGRRGDVLVNVTADPLAWYLHRGIIEIEQHAAGDRLGRLYRRAIRSPVSANGMEITNGSGRWPGDMVRCGEALTDYNAAVRAMRALEGRVVWTVACWGDFASQAAQRLGVSPRRGIQLLRAGLDDLRAFFRG